MFALVSRYVSGCEVQLPLTTLGVVSVNRQAGLERVNEQVVKQRGWPIVCWCLGRSTLKWRREVLVVTFGIG